MVKSKSKANTSKDASNGVRENILYILGIFPNISPSMLHITLGGSLPTSIWKPILEDLVDQDFVIRTQLVSQAPNGRMRHHTLLKLSIIGHEHEEVGPKK